MMFGIPREKRADSKHEAAARCGFCNRGHAEASKLIAGPTVMICDDCVRTCVDILAARASDSTENGEAFQEQQARLEARRLNAGGSAEAVPEEMIPLWHVRCGLCRQIVATDATFSIDGRGLLCEDCVVAVQQIRRHRRGSHEQS